MQSLLRTVESAKQQLSECEQTRISIPSFGGGRGLHVPVARADLEEATAPLLSRLWPPLETLGTQAHVAWATRCFTRHSKPFCSERQLKCVNHCAWCCSCFAAFKPVQAHSRAGLVPQIAATLGRQPPTGCKVPQVSTVQDHLIFTRNSKHMPDNSDIGSA